MSKNKKEDKQLLEEGTIRRFMTLAKIPSVTSQPFFSKLNEEKVTPDPSPEEVKSGGLAKKGENDEFGSEKSSYPHKMKDISPDHSKNLAPGAPKKGVLEETAPVPEEKEEEIPLDDEMPGEDTAVPPADTMEPEMSPEPVEEPAEIEGEADLKVEPELAAKIIAGIAKVLGIPVDVKTGEEGEKEEEEPAPSIPTAEEPEKEKSAEELKEEETVPGDKPLRQGQSRDDRPPKSSETQLNETKKMAQNIAKRILARLAKKA